MVDIFVYIIFIFIIKTNGFLFDDKEDLILLPSVAFRDHSKISSTNWIVSNQGWYYEEDPLQAKVMEKILEKTIEKDFDINRIKLFTADGQENKKVCIDNFNQSICTHTDHEGRIKNTFQISKNEIDQLIQSDINGTKILYQQSVFNKNIRTIGEIYLCDDNGITFISDIDDTIKVTGVTSSTETLMNTFTGSYKSVLGMSDIYQYWQKKYNATFAYLTASPDQLYPFLREFINREKFPLGSFHMRHFTWFDTNFISFFMSNNYIESKTEAIDMFLNNTLNRRFILIGDIFQKDPDIYASIYMKYPNRIEKIFIRKYKNDTIGQQRLEQIFNNIPQENWATFEIGSDLPKDIFLV
ncbi:unnamed protein product [Rotaria sordida]|uniref:Phosphatidate phosphatase APP1 catalytic domain-containing protein n=1 Tax=Rotaria sordida TaxID=392033 RepID=A0A814SYT5_9BILA|nr:unnamed protein product [Rotaria sordida]CAF1135747.1 unnamed protein product [Rotaria sordida]CAF1154363.1 unnamed protein product [Rotaria sordida]